jgi:hypothetical protein
MLITSEQAESRLNSQKNTANLVTKANDGKLIIKEINRGGGRSDGQNNLTESQRILIGKTAQLDSPRNVAEAFHISESHVYNLRKGQTDRDHLQRKTHPELKSAIVEKREEIKDRALDKLLSTLNIISEDKLSILNAKDASKVAVNLSRVHGNMTPQESNNGKVNITIYTPQMRSVKEYDVVEI